MREPPKITVVIATFNAARTVERAIRSVNGQTYQNLELIVVDGVSSDETVDIVKSHAKENLTILCEKDTGIYDAWNKGVNASSGEWIIFIGADDVLASQDSISSMVSRMPEQNSGTDIFYGDLILLDIDGKPIGKLGAPWINPWSFRGRYITSSFPIPIIASLFRREMLLRHGLFDPTLSIAADIDLVLRSAKHHAPIYVPGLPVTEMGFGGVSTNPRSAIRLLKEAVIVRRRHGLGAFTNLGFLLLCFKVRAKAFIGTILGAKAERQFIRLLHGIKQVLRGGNAE